MELTHMSETPQQFDVMNSQTVPCLTGVPLQGRNYQFRTVSVG